MSRRARGCGSAVLLAFLFARPTVAAAQACCAGSTTTTPARLELHEDALAGVTVRAADVFGLYDQNAHYSAYPSHTSEVDLEQDFFGAVRVLGRGELSLLIPVLETARSVPGERAIGGGAGDVNFGFRYDFLRAGEHRIVPGIAFLAGLTVPTGTPVNGATQPLAVDATGAGAYQINLGLALEQSWGAWIVGLSGIAALETTYSAGGVQETPAAQYTALGWVTRVFRRGSAVGLSLAYSAQGEATINGALDANSVQRFPTASLLGLCPVWRDMRLQGSLYVNPPLSALGQNQPTSAGLTLTLVFGFS